jgi:hypothetical protein
MNVLGGWARHSTDVNAREEQQLLESDKLAAEFASLSGKLNTVTDINHVLGKVFTALAEKRISQQAAAIIVACHLLWSARCITGLLFPLMRNLRFAGVGSRILRDTRNGREKVATDSANERPET